MGFISGEREGTPTIACASTAKNLKIFLFLLGITGKDEETETDGGNKIV